MIKQGLFLLMFVMLGSLAFVSPKADDIDFEHIYKTWYVKQAIINGKQDPQMSAGNNEMTFAKDGAFTEVDNNRGKTSKGTWKIAGADKIEITLGDYTSTYAVHLLTETNLELEMLGDEHFKLEFKLEDKK